MIEFNRGHAVVDRLRLNVMLDIRQIFCEIALAVMPTSGTRT